MVSIFSGTPRDGHGQHQAAGWAAQEAFRVAGDSTVFPELSAQEGLAPFAPLKLYPECPLRSAATTLTLDGGMLDPAVGQSFHQIAMRGRSLHRSQDMGQIQGMGPSLVRLQLLQDRTGKGGDGLWNGVDNQPGFPPAGRTASRRWAAAGDGAPFELCRAGGFRSGGTGAAQVGRDSETCFPGLVVTSRARSSRSGRLG